MKEQVKVCICDACGFRGKGRRYVGCGHTLCFSHSTGSRCRVCREDADSGACTVFVPRGPGVDAACNMLQGLGLQLGALGSAVVTEVRAKDMLLLEREAPKVGLVLERMTGGGRACLRMLAGDSVYAGLWGVRMEGHAAPGDEELAHLAVGVAASQEDWDAEQASKCYVWLRYARAEVQAAREQCRRALPLGSGREERVLAAPAALPPGHVLLQQDLWEGGSVGMVVGADSPRDVALILAALQRRSWTPKGLDLLASSAGMEPGGWAHVDERAAVGALVLQWARCVQSLLPWRGPVKRSGLRADNPPPQSSARRAPRPLLRAELASPSRRSPPAAGARVSQPTC